MPTTKTTNFTTKSRPTISEHLKAFLTCSCRDLETVIETVSPDLVLLHACSQGDLDLLNMVIDLVSAGSLNAALLVAAEKGLMEIASLLLEKGATNIPEALNKAMAFGQTEIANLISKGGIIGEITNALDNAVMSGDAKTADVLVVQSVAYWNDALVKACASGQLDVVKMTLEKGAGDLVSALGVAKSSNQKEIVRYLLELGETQWMK